MAHDSRYFHRVSHSDSNNDSKSKESDISSVLEYLSEVKERDEENTSRTSDTGLVTSPGRMTPLNDASDHEASELPRMGGMGVGIGTPSTVSTAPSTDDASFGTEYKLDDSFLPNLLQGTPGHSRSQSWGEERLLPGVSATPQMPYLDDAGGAWGQGGNTQSFAQYPGPEMSPSQPQQQRVASFRDTAHYAQPASHSHDPIWPQQHSQPPAHPGHQRRHTPDQAMQFLGHGGQQLSMDTRQGLPHYPQPFGGYEQAARRGYSGPVHGNLSHDGTPPRPSKNQRQPGQLGHSNGHRDQRQPHTGNQSGTPHQPGSSTQRSSSEILKTLLRKKACLYEPDTSRSVALVTWLVGRELALEHGFFSRQQLQSGVHACVSDKIDSGTITRTKVNRCMQIILNSCFHYIIPRSDGTEEKGDAFREFFLQNVNDDSSLLRYLPAPWNHLHVNREEILEASLVEHVDDKHQSPHKSTTSPKSSPKLASLNATYSPRRESKEPDDAESKRAVLLCFNENVRSAEDVFRCHNEFIRDTANAAHLQLTAQDWRAFFDREAARAPYLWDNIGIPVPSAETKAGASGQNDVLGQLNEDEAGKFRTTWCAKRYDHDHDMCGFAHVEVNGGWLRRNPAIHPYLDEMCGLISTAGDKSIGPSHFFVNECPDGVHCEKAHSMEEIMYHPKRYKSKTCTAVLSRSGGCQLGDVCPNVHPAEASRSSKKSGDGRSHSQRHPRKHEHHSSGPKSSGISPTGSPIVYASPAPFSSFERQLGMPGLQSLFRRHCSVVRAQVRTGGKCRCLYSCFGDDWAITSRLQQAPKLRPGLPPPQRSV